MTKVEFHGGDDDDDGWRIKNYFQLEELINRVSERTELADFLLDVVAQLKIGDIKEFDKTINTEDKLEALGETSRGAVVAESYRRCQAGKHFSSN